MAHVENLNKNGSSIVYAGFTPTLICSGAISDTKTVTFPTGFSAASEENLAFKVVFVNGHNALNPYDNMTLNGVAVVTNQQGTLAPIPIHEITESGNTVYKVLGANVALDLYYTSDYDGNGTAAYVVAGNPIVLSSSDYTIYADGYNAIEKYSITEVKTNKVWIDGKPIYRKVYTPNVPISGTWQNTDFANPYYTGYTGDIDRIVKIDTTDGLSTAIELKFATSIQWMQIAEAYGTNGRNPSSLIIEYTKTTD